MNERRPGCMTLQKNGGHKDVMAVQQAKEEQEM